MSEPSIFTRILKGEIPAEIIAETENAFAIRDIAPKAPVHLLVIPKTEEYRNVVELAAGDPDLLAELVGLANTVAAEHSDGDFRLVFNTGPGAGQTVFHVHAHVLAGDLRRSESRCLTNPTDHGRARLRGRRRDGPAARARRTGCCASSSASIPTSTCTCAATRSP